MLNVPQTAPEIAHLLPPASTETIGSCYTFRYSSSQIHRTPKTHLTSKNMKLNKVQEGFLAALQRPTGKNSTSDKYRNFTPFLLGKDQAVARTAARRNRRETPKMRRRESAQQNLSISGNHGTVNSTEHFTPKRGCSAKEEYFSHPRPSAEGGTSGDKAQHLVIFPSAV